jgi:hypothetical protein
MKPPRSTQFKPGQSGNPNGRPAKVLKVTDLLLKRAHTVVTITAGDKSQRVSMLEAIVMKLLNKAATGDPKSTAIVLKELGSTDQDRVSNISDLLDQFRKISAAHENTGRKTDEVKQEDDGGLSK